MSIIPWWQPGVDELYTPLPQTHGNWLELWFDQVALRHALVENACSYKRTFEGFADKEDSAALISWVESRLRKVLVPEYGSSEIRAVYVNDTTLVQLFFSPEDRDFQLTFVTQDTSLIDDFIVFSKDKLKSRSDFAGEVYMLGEALHQFRLYHIGHGGIPFDRENYSPETLESYDKMARHLGAGVPKGRLVILDGPPGTGKTFLVRGLIEEVGNAVFIYIPASLVPSLDKPSFIPVLLEVANGNPGPKVLIIEDADTLLLQRGIDNMTGISTLLNVTDGTFGDLIDLRVIATTNARRIDIDKAMQRRGRILEVHTLKKLTAIHANSVWDRLTKGLKVASPGYKDKTLLGDIYADAIEVGWQAPSRKARLFQAKSSMSRLL